MSDTAPSMRMYGRHLLICTGGTCADPEAGEALIAAAPELFGERRRLRNPERIKCSAADCLGVCRGGPIAVVYPDGIWYHHVDRALLARIVEEHLIGGRPVEEAVFHRLYPPGQEPPYAPSARGDEGTFAQASAAATGGQDAPAIERSDTSIESSEEKIARRVAVRKRNYKKGLVVINTGNGKGKTTAALGVMTRAWGRGLRVHVLQFLKHENARFGENRAARKMEIDFGGTGDGFTWTSNDIDQSQARALAGWERAKHIIQAGNHDIVILDEFTYPLSFGWLAAAEVIEWLREHKPPLMHLIITGRDAPPELIEYADLVTEMREVKHPFKQQGVRAQPGIEF